jgi:hypothetical protein
LWSHRSRKRRFEVLSLPLAATREAAHRWGGTINDIFLTGAVEAGRRYHLERGEDPELFHITFVVSTRSDDTSGANAFTPVPVQLPAGPLPLAERFHKVHESLRQRRSQVHGGGPLAAVASLATILPTPVLTGLVRSQASHIDFATSNLPGFLGETYVTGAKMLHSYSFGPLAGTAFNLTQLSVGELLDIGAHIDPAAVTDPPRLRELLEETYAELLAGP